MKLNALCAGLWVAALATPALAGGYQENLANCLAKNANPHDAATVLLQCTAEGGKLSGCTVLENSVPGKGFDKAAVCMAETLPIGSKTGEMKVPIRFPGGG